MTLEEWPCTEKGRSSSSNVKHLDWVEEGPQFDIVTLEVSCCSQTLAVVRFAIPTVSIIQIAVNIERKGASSTHTDVCFITMNKVAIQLAPRIDFGLCNAGEGEHKALSRTVISLSILQALCQVASKNTISSIFDH